MNYHTSIANIRSMASGIGRELTRPQAVDRLSGTARKSAQNNNVLNSDIIEYREIGPYIAELALVDFTGMRGGTYMCGVTVWKDSESCFDLSECIDIDKVADKLHALREFRL